MSDIVWKIKDFEQLSPRELYEILKIRQEVFIVEQTCYYLDADGADEFAIHIWAELQQQIVAYCRIFAPNRKYAESSLGRVLTHRSARNRNLGQTLIDISIRVIEARFNTTRIRISAQDYLIKFYERFGFKSTGRSYQEDDIPHTEMLRE